MKVSTKDLPKDIAQALQIIGELGRMVDECNSVFTVLNENRMSFLSLFWLGVLHRDASLDAEHLP